MKKIIIALILVVALAVGGIGFTLKEHGQNYPNATQLTQNKNIKIAVLSDTHVLAPTLHDNGTAWQNYQQTSAGVDVRYSAQIFATTIKHLRKTKPDIVLIAGDLTSNGEAQSAQYVANGLKQLRKAGIKTYVVPGNHEINNPEARSFSGNQEHLTDRISPAEFKNIFAYDGYEQATTTDAASLSYLVQPSKKLWLLMLDSNRYEQNASLSKSIQDGYFNKRTLKYIQQTLTAVKKAHATVIPVMHHTALVHANLAGNFALANHVTFDKILRANDVDLTISGHMHAPSITTQDGLTDITQGALPVTPHYLGELTYQADNGALHFQATPLPLAQAWQQQYGPSKAQTMLNYDHEVLYQSGYRFAMRMLASSPRASQLPAKQQTRIASAFARVNQATFAGKAATAPADIKLLQTIPDEQLRQVLRNTNLGKHNLSWSSTKISDTP